jgi:4-hydroxybenzoate polyprenyltransferase
MNWFTAGKKRMETVAAPDSPEAGQGAWLIRFGRLIRFSHTIFAAPFALGAMLVAANGLPAWSTVGWILLCLVSARTVAMIFNRLVDWEWDKLNPRTQDRHQLVTRGSLRVMFFVSAAVFVLAAAMLNTLCAALAPIALMLICFYSLTKRFTPYCHAFLGLALSAAPMGAWAGVTGSLLEPTPYFLAAGVLAWVFGFDLIYATLDRDFDRSVGLQSFPARFGLEATLRLAVGLHLMSAIFLGWFGWAAGLGWAYLIAWALMIPILVLEHRWSRSGDPQMINRAFFKMNAMVSLLFLGGVCLDLWIMRP